MTNPILFPIMAHGWAKSPERLTIALAVTFAFAGLARILRGVDQAGAMAGGICCLLLFAGAGPSGFAMLAVLFMTTWAATRLGHRRKLSLGLAESREGRNAWQVLANLGAAAICSVLFSSTGNRGWLIAAIAALTESATDTVASEIGQSSGANPRLITTLQVVSAGTDGGITVIGSAAGLAAGLVIAGVAIIGGLLPYAQIWIAVAAGFFGMLFDSILGATLQRRGRLSNQAVNFCSTLAAAAIAFSLFSI